ncbi:MBL fold metallo-hydrolase [Amnibacterium kyonggiense]|uniref:Glyoxylase-like metal-dependent hydrolase (Beta-lactamase superfamily II) n=1 Tax=Amnibacterium kyonggiense TaxID=595671 RepID=A0A4R7FGZ8_9MICO|nr:MBL fold metallo-hydrolase [Amnibacterium kyonggiense]TDS76055.1 glyoxylase-like metal-dependent hydrolase (beta-lactamase superfamily II) [Amnibacterium kyonggiense]
MPGTRSNPHRSTDARLTRIADGVHQLTHGGVNCYLLEEDDRVTIVDAALPRTWGPLQQALAVLGRQPEDVAALVLTHAHFDHVGFARRLAAEYDVPVYAHRLEHHLAAHPYDYAHERSRLPYPILHPAALPTLAAMARAGALQVRGIDEVLDLPPGEPLDVPGRPTVLFVPGHTFGHCALHLPDRDIVLTGDALVTLDPYTGRLGPRIVAGAATADSVANLRSLDVLETTFARIVLPGHGDAWTGGIRSAVSLARVAGAA